MSNLSKRGALALTLCLVLNGWQAGVLPAFADDCRGVYSLMCAGDPVPDTHREIDLDALFDARNRNRSAKLYNKGLKLFNSGRYQQALDYFQQAQGYTPDDAETQRMISQTHKILEATELWYLADEAYRNQNLSQAIVYEEQVYGLSPEVDNGRLNFYRQVQVMEEQERLRQAQVLYGEAQDLIKQRNFDEAEKKRRQAFGLVKFQDGLFVFLNLMENDIKAEKEAYDIKKAIDAEDYDQAVTMLTDFKNRGAFSPRLFEVLNTGNLDTFLADLKTKQAQKKAQEQLLISTGGLDPKHLPVIDPSVLKNWDPPNTSYGKPVPQLDQLKALPPMNPKHPATQNYDAGFDAMRQGNPQLAVQKFEAARKLNPNDPRITNALDLAKMTLNARQAKSANMANAIKLVAQGNAVVKLNGDYAKGYAAFNDALALDPMNRNLQDAKTFMGELFKAQTISSGQPMDATQAQWVSKYTSEAGVMLASGKYDQAYNCMLQAYSLAPQSTITKTGLAKTWELYNQHK